MHFKVQSTEDAQNLSNLLKDGDWMILYYADWCGHCQTMKPEWKKVVNKLTNKSKPDCNVAEIESSHIGSLTNSPKVAGYPTIKMFNSGKEVANFEDDRVADKITKFALANSKMVNSMAKQTVLNHNMKMQMPMNRMQMPMKIHNNIKHIKVKMPKKKRTIIIHRHHKRTVSNTHKVNKHKHHKSHRKSHRKSQNNKIRNTTSDVFTQLIKSFKRIGQEAKTDARILKSASNKL